MNTQNKTMHRSFTGVVVSNKMDKTLVVRVDRTLVHPKYGKRYVRSEKFHVHAPEGTYEIGQTVSFHECRPLSKTKRWTIAK